MHISHRQLRKTCGEILMIQLQRIADGLLSLVAGHYCLKGKILSIQVKKQFLS